MKKIFLLILAFSCIGHAMAQHCNFDKDETDKFTGKRVVVDAINLGKQVTFFVAKNGDKYVIALGMVFGGDDRLYISPGDTMMIAIENGKPIVLTSTQEAKPVTSVSVNQVVSQYYCEYEISKQDLIQLSQQDMTAIRVNFGHIAVDLPIKSKHLDKVATAATCILSL